MRFKAMIWRYFVVYRLLSHDKKKLASYQNAVSTREMTNGSPLCLFNYVRCKVRKTIEAREFRPFLFCFGELSHPNKFNTRPKRVNNS